MLQRCSSVTTVVCFKSFQNFAKHSNRQFRHEMLSQCTVLKPHEKSHWVRVDVSSLQCPVVIYDLTLKVIGDIAKCCNSEGEHFPSANATFNHGLYKCKIHDEMYVHRIF